MASPNSEQGTAAGDGGWYDEGRASQQQPLPPQASGAQQTSAAHVPPEAHNLVKEVYRAFGKNRVLVPMHLRHLLDSFSPKPWQEQVKGEAWRLTKVQQQLEKLTATLTLHKQAWADFETDLQTYHQRNHAVYIDGLKAMEEDISAARLEELQISQELKTLTATFPAATVVHGSEEEDMEDDRLSEPQGAGERQWYGAANFEAQQQQAEAAAVENLRRQEAQNLAAQLAARAQAMADAEDLSARQAAFLQAQAVAAEHFRVAQLEQAAKVAAHQLQQQQDLQRFATAQAQAQSAAQAQAQQQQLPHQEDSVELTIDADEEEDTLQQPGLPTFTPPSLDRTSMRGYRPSGDSKRQATDVPVLGFHAAEEDKKQD